MKDFHYLLDYGIVFPGKAGKGRNDDVSHRGHTRRIVVVNEEDSPLRVQKVHRIRVKPLNHSGTSAARRNRGRQDSNLRRQSLFDSL